MRMNGATVLLTGAAGGIGRTLARRIGGNIVPQVGKSRPTGMA